MARNRNLELEFVSPGKWATADGRFGVIKMPKPINPMLVTDILGKKKKHIFSIRDLRAFDVPGNFFELAPELKQVETYREVFPWLGSYTREGSFEKGNPKQKQAKFQPVKRHAHEARENTMNLRDMVQTLGAITGELAESVIGEDKTPQAIEIVKHQRGFQVVRFRMSSGLGMLPMSNKSRPEVYSTLEQARAAVPKGWVKVKRDSSDPSGLVETWKSKKNFYEDVELAENVLVEKRISLAGGMFKIMKRISDAETTDLLATVPHLEKKIAKVGDFSSERNWLNMVKKELRKRGALKEDVELSEAVFKSGSVKSYKSGSYQGLVYKKYIGIYQDGGDYRVVTLPSGQPVISAKNLSQAKVIAKLTHEVIKKDRHLDRMEYRVFHQYVADVTTGVAKPLTYKTWIKNHAKELGTKVSSLS